MSRAYYNEFEPYAAAWLRNLIAAGHIAPGDVDERSIADVHPSDLKGYTQCHFFAGVGVWSYALRLAGWPDDRPVWSGSCPCQPFSTSGRGKGFDDERHLWPAWHHLISQCRPSEVFGEQVDGNRVGPWLDLVQADMEGVHYAFGAGIFPAAGVGAPHRRHRTYFVAYAEVGGLIEGGRSHGGHLGARDGSYDDSFDGLMVQPLGARLEGHGRNGDDGHQSGRIGAQPGGSASEAGRGAGLLADASRAGAGRNAGAVPGAQGEGEGERIIDRHQPDRYINGGAVGELADAHGDRWPEGRGRISSSGHDGPFGNSLYVARSGGRPGPTNGFWRDPDWLFCRDGKWRPVEPGTSPLAHGASSRVGRLRAYGNAIVSQQAAAFISAYLEARG